MNYPQYYNYGTPAPPPQKSGGKGWLVVLLIFGGLFGLGCLCCGGGGVWMYFAAQPPKDVVVDLTTPDACRVGDTIVLLIEVDNTSPKSREISSITLDSGFTDGFTLTGSDPPQVSTTDMFGFKVIEYLHSIGPHSTEVIEVSFEATTAGSWSGTVDVTIDGKMTPINGTIRTKVEP
ncbi:MAG: hypothetical protein AAGC44_02140 [Planctomycetota bacterium]